MEKQSGNDPSTITIAQLAIIKGYINIATGLREIRPDVIEYNAEISYLCAKIDNDCQKLLSLLKDMAQGGV